MAVLRAIGGNIALRWSAGPGMHSWIYKHSAPLELTPYLVAALAVLSSLVNLRREDLQQRYRKLVLVLD
jgi:hypothetical protein